MTELETVAYLRKSSKTGEIRFSETPMHDSTFNRTNWEELPLVTLSSAQSAIAERDARIAELEAMLQKTVEETSDQIAALMIRAEAAEALLKEAREALEPFAKAVRDAEVAAAHFQIDHHAEVPDSKPYGKMGPSWGHLRAARTIYHKIGSRNGE